MLSVAAALSTNDVVAGGQGRRPWTNAAACVNRVLPGAEEPSAGPAGVPPSTVRVAALRVAPRSRVHGGAPAAVGCSLVAAAPAAA